MQSAAALHVVRYYRQRTVISGMHCVMSKFSATMGKDLHVGWAVYSYSMFKKSHNAICCPVYGIITALLKYLTSKLNCPRFGNKAYSKHPKKLFIAIFKNSK
jgi:hypothetical protein